MSASSESRWPGAPAVRVRGGLVPLLLAALTACGCQGWPSALEGWTPDRDASLPGGSAETTRGGDRAVLADDGWVLRVQPPSASPGRDAGESAGESAVRRWRHARLEDVLARPPDRRPDFAAALGDARPVVGANAAIALARSGDARGAAALADAVRNPDLPLPLRCAAAEALGELPPERSAPPLGELLDQYGRHSGEAAGRYLPEIHAELLRALGRSIDAADDPRMVEALRSPSVEVRLAALRAWMESRRGVETLPVEALDQRGHGDPRLRIAVMDLVARRRPPRAEEYLEAGLRDWDLDVRLAAVAALGRFGGPGSRASLKVLLEEHSDRIRAAAVAALAALGDWGLVRQAAGDESWRVRIAVARALADCPPGPCESGAADRGSLVVAEKLLKDPSAEVQMATVESLAAWPTAEAGPLLLAVIGGEAYATRAAAVRQLAARWPVAEEYPVDGPAERRVEVLARLKSRFAEEFGPAAPRADAVAPSAARQVASEDVARVENQLAASDVAGLRGAGPALVPILEEIALRRHRALPPWVYRDVLPGCEPVFATLERLESPDLMERRRAAEEIARRAAEKPLGPLAVERLAQQILADNDPLVWQSALGAVAGDGTPSALRLVTAAMSHPAPEVRRRACVHLAAHPSPDHARLLLPALEDQHLSVLREAIRALGTLGRIDDRGSLRAMLAHGNEEIRLETAAALARLGDPAGPPALEQLGYSPDPAIRRQTAEWMGALGDPTFAPTLVRLLDDRVGVARAALDALPRVVGYDAAEQNPTPPEHTTERMRRWKEWGRRQAVSAQAG